MVREMDRVPTKVEVGMRNGMPTRGDCDHERTRTLKRARESHEVEEWENKIIEQCQDCGEYILT